MTVVIDNWHILEEKSAQRKSDLHATTDLFLFLSEVAIIHHSPQVINTNFK